jgi:hypothetical protein
MVAAEAPALKVLKIFVRWGIPPGTPTVWPADQFTIRFVGMMVADPGQQSAQRINAELQRYLRIQEPSKFNLAHRKRNRLATKTRLEISLWVFAKASLIGSSLFQAWGVCP